MAMERWRPFGTLMEREPFRDIQSEVNRLFDSFLGRPTATATGTGSRAGCRSSTCMKRTTISS
jgi:hypothetical protein